LLYVAMTRAQDQLHIMVPLRCYAQQQATYGDHHAYAGRTRFIPDTLLSAFEPKSWHLEGSLVPTVPLVRGLQLDVGARARAQWR
jgi:DNA helicase II / ATP-dependent DNA helicase PcrA